jgi:hypothetical protein
MAVNQVESAGERYPCRLSILEDGKLDDRVGRCCAILNGVPCAVIIGTTIAAEAEPVPDRRRRAASCSTGSRTAD